MRVYKAFIIHSRENYMQLHVNLKAMLNKEKILQGRNIVV